MAGVASQTMSPSTPDSSVWVWHEPDVSDIPVQVAETSRSGNSTFTDPTSIRRFTCAAISQLVARHVDQNGDANPELGRLFDDENLYTEATALADNYMFCTTGRTSIEDALSSPLVDTRPLTWDYRGTREKMTLPFGATLREFIQTSGSTPVSMLVLERDSDSSAMIIRFMASPAPDAGMEDVQAATKPKFVVYNASEMYGSEASQRHRFTLASSGYHVLAVLRRIFCQPMPLSPSPSGDWTEHYLTYTCLLPDPHSPARIISDFCGRYPQLDTANTDIIPLATHPYRVGRPRRGTAPPGTRRASSLEAQHSSSTGLSGIESAPFDALDELPIPPPQRPGHRATHSLPLYAGPRDASSLTIMTPPSRPARSPRRAFPSANPFISDSEADTMTSQATASASSPQSHVSPSSPPIPTIIEHLEDDDSPPDYTTEDGRGSVLASLYSSSFTHSMSSLESVTEDILDAPSPTTSTSSMASPKGKGRQLEDSEDTSPVASTSAPARPRHTTSKSLEIPTYDTTTSGRRYNAPSGSVFFDLLLLDALDTEFDRAPECRVECSSSTDSILSALMTPKSPASDARTELAAGPSLSRRGARRYSDGSAPGRDRRASVAQSEAAAEGSDSVEPAPGVFLTYYTAHDPLVSSSPDGSTSPAFSPRLPTEEIEPDSPAERVGRRSMEPAGLQRYTRTTPAPTPTPAAEGSQSPRSALFEFYVPALVPVPHPVPTPTPTPAPAPVQNTAPPRSPRTRLGTYTPLTPPAQGSPNLGAQLLQLPSRISLSRLRLLLGIPSRRDRSPSPVYHLPPLDRHTSLADDILAQLPSTSRSHSQRRAPRTGGLDCAICLQDAPKREVAIVPGCRHVFCWACLRQYVTARLDDGKLSMPCPGCAATGEANADAQDISRDFIEYMELSQEERDTLERLELAEFAVLHQCPRCHKSAYIDREQYMEHGVIDCPLPSCGAHSCKHCLKEIVYSDREETHQCGSEELVAYMSRSGAKRCPGCSTPIERNEGCNHMTCTVAGCSTHFCYRCGDSIIRSTKTAEIRLAVQSHYEVCRMFDN